MITDIQININHNVTVILDTQEAVDILNQYKPIEKFYKINDQYTEQFWYVMKIFDPLIEFGRSLPFKAEVVVHVES